MQPILTISILISRNIDGVKRCLDSVCPIMDKIPTVILLTDTGCGSDVRNLIEEFVYKINDKESDGLCAKIIEFEWIKDFSAARNVGLEEAKSNGSEWFMYIDDDEWFDESNLDELIDFFKSGACNNYNVATYIQRNYLDVNGSAYSDHVVDRILRIGTDLHFTGRIHEAYTGIDIGTKKQLNVFVHHYGYVYTSDEEKQSKSKRNRELIKLEIKEYPDNMRMHYQLVMDCYSVGDYDEAIKAGFDAISKNSNSQYWDAIHSEILYCYQAKKEWNNVIKYGEKFLCDNLFAFDEFGVKQYLINAYWNNRNYDKVCGLALQVIDTYVDYKINPAKYDANQLLRDEFWQADNINNMLVNIIDSAIAINDKSVIDRLIKGDMTEELSAMVYDAISKIRLMQIELVTCTSDKQVELIQGMPFYDDINIDKYYLDVDAPKIEFRQLEFEPEFFDAEIRDGFEIEPLIKHAWAAQLQTLSMLDQICEVNNLTYSANWGTLLGAVRHKGFIPWDDDLDVCMAREDFIKLSQIICNYPELKFFNIYNMPEIGIHAARLNLSDEYTIDRDRLKLTHGFPFPVGLDIFVVDYVTNDDNVRSRQRRVMLDLARAIDELESINADGDEDGKHHEEFLTVVKEIKERYNLRFGKSEPSIAELTRLYDGAFNICNESDAVSVAEMQCLMVGYDYRLNKNTYKNIIRLPFENITIPAPVDYDTVLRVKYGDDYMTPIRGGGGHDYPFYNRIIRGIASGSGSTDFDITKHHIERTTGEFYKKFLLRDTKCTINYDETRLNESPNNRTQAALLEVLSEIDRLCNDNNIRYHYVGDTIQDIDAIKELSSDSLDIHLGMMRSDYMRFVNVLQEELDPWFDYRSIYSHAEHLDLRMYVITDAFMTKEGEYERRFYGSNDIVGIDIAPIDMINADSSVEELKKTVIAQLIQTAPALPTSAPYSDDILSIVNEWEEMLHVGIDTGGNLQQQFMQAADSVAMSDAGSGSGTVRITSDIMNGNYRLYSIDELDGR